MLANLGTRRTTRHGACEVCDTVGYLFVDHTEVPPRHVRGLLCHHCNTRILDDRIRFTQRMSGEWLARAHEYLATR